MSGGHYNYLYSQVSDLAERILADCVGREIESTDRYGFKVEALEPDILAHMKFIANELQVLADAARDIEWYMSGDYGEDTLRTRCDSWKLSEGFR